MIILGVILMILGFVAAVPMLWTIGVILVVVGFVLWILGSMGHAVGGRRLYY
jgi:fatty-acid desaturase